jgi:hypothetical protein
VTCRPALDVRGWMHCVNVESLDDSVAVAQRLVAGSEDSLVRDVQGPCGECIRNLATGPEGFSAARAGLKVSRVAWRAARGQTEEFGLSDSYGTEPQLG